MFHPMFLLLLIAPKQKNFCVTKDRVPLRGLAKAGPRIVCFTCRHIPPLAKTGPLVYNKIGEIYPDGWPRRASALPARLALWAETFGFVRDVLYFVISLPYNKKRIALCNAQG